MINIAILASGNGTNAENIAKVFNGGDKIKVKLVVTNREKAGVVQRMEPLGVECAYVPNQAWDETPEKVVEFLKDEEIDLIVLAGFMHYVSPVIINAYKDRILNIHPSLLPAYGGKGMYGHHVHEAVIANNEKDSGVTVHVVTDEMDKGEIVMQQKVEITEEDTPETLEAKIHPVEYDLYPRAIMEFVQRMERERRQSGIEAQWADVLHINYDKEKGIPTPPRYSTPEPPAAPASPAMNVVPPYGTPGQVAGMEMAKEHEPMPNTYLLWSILVTIFCCLPLGVIAIIYSSAVSTRYYRGDYEGARKSSRNAEIWIIVSFCLGVIGNTLYLPLMMLAS